MKTVKRKDHWPKWANYKATDADGYRCFYEEEPYMLARDWQYPCNSSFQYRKPKKNYKGDWKKSLRKIEHCGE